MSTLPTHLTSTLRDRLLLETQAEHLLRVLERGSVSTNLYLRLIHSFTMDMSWLSRPVPPKKCWPAVKLSEKRSITRAEYEAILPAS
jgi:hypothetical protein